MSRLIERTRRRAVRILWPFAVVVGFLSIGASTAAAAVPATPFVESVAARGLGALVTWAPAAARDGVSGWEVTMTAARTDAPAACSTPVVATAPASDTSIVAPGLCSGVAYVARIRARNASGWSVASQRSNPVVPLEAQPPTAPLITSVLARDGALVVSWAPTASDGGRPLTKYALTATAGASTITADAGPSATSATVTGLVNGTAYTVVLRAVNSVGPSEEAKQTGTPARVHAPAPPRQVAAAPSGDGAVSVSWQAPDDDGGAAVSAYDVVSQQVVRSGTGWVSAPGSAASSRRVTGTSTSLADLSPANGVFMVSVFAVNSAGRSAAAKSPAPVTPTTSVKADTVVLTGSTMSALRSTAGGALTWGAPAPAQVAGLQVGQVLVGAPGGAAPQGLLRKVTAVTKRSDGGYVVATVRGALSDAFASVSLASSTNPVAPIGASGAGSTFTPARAGVAVERGAGIGISDHLGLAIEIGTANASISGSVDLSCSFALGANVSRDLVGIPNGAQLSATAKVEAKSSLDVNLKGSRSFKIGEIRSPPVLYQIGPVPVIVVYRTPVYLKASGAVSVGVSAAATVGLRADWDSRSPRTLTVTNQSGFRASGRPLDNVKLSGAVGFSFEPQAALYDATGPKFSLEPQLQAEVDPMPGPGSPWLSIGPTVDLKAGWGINLLGHNASLEVRLARKTFTNFYLTTAPPARYSVSPGDVSVPAGSQRTFTAARSDGTQKPITWKLVGGAGDTISSDGTLKTVGPQGRQLTVVASDSSGATGKATVTVGTPFDPPAVLDFTSDKDGAGGTLSWGAPDRTGGSSLSSYTVVVQQLGGARTVAASTLSTALRGMSPGETYIISVFATNAAGLRSPAAVGAFTPEVTCSVSWKGENGSSWSDASNWAPPRVPTSDDLVCIDDGGEADLSADTTVYGLRLGGALVTDSTLRVTNLASIRGTVSGAGAVVTAPASRLTLAAGAYIDGRVRNYGVATVSGTAGDVYIAGTLQNSGLMTLPGGVDLGYYSEGRLINDAGATLTSNGNTTFTVPLTNNGTLSSTGGTLEVSSELAVGTTSTTTGAGEIDVTGTLHPVGTQAPLQKLTISGLVSGGTLTVASGRTVRLSSGAEIYEGTLRNRGTVNVIGDDGHVYVETGGVLQNSGTLTLPGGVDVGYYSDGQMVNDAGATLTSEGDTTITLPLINNGTLSPASGTLEVRGDLAVGTTSTTTGAGEIDVTGSLHPVGDQAPLQRLTISGSISGGTLTVASGQTVRLRSGASLYEGTLRNLGTLDVIGTDGYLYVGSGGVLQNSGSMALPGGVDVGYYSDGQLINDAGATLASAGDASITVPLTNHGTLSSTSGALEIRNELAVGTTSTTTGAGVIDVTGRLHPVGTQAPLQKLTISGSVTGGTLTVASGRTVRLRSGASLYEGTLRNLGTLKVIGSDGDVYVGTDGVLRNSAAMTLPGGVSVGYYSDGRMINDPAGTVTSLAGTEITVPFDNRGTVVAGGGVLTVSVGNSAGETDYGAWKVPAGSTLDFAGGTRRLGTGSTVTGDGEVAVHGAVVVRGTVSGPTLRLASGALSLSPVASLDVQTFSQGNPATLEFFLSNDSVHVAPGRFNVRGAASFDGYLRISPVFDYFPPSRERYPLMQYASRTGRFYSIDTQPGYAVQVGATALQASFTSGVSG